MKNSIYSLVFMAFLMLACGGKDDNVPATNNPPGIFNLIAVPNNEENVDRMPLLSWEVAVDPEGDTVTYNVFLQKPNDGDQLIANGLSAPEFQITSLLSLIQEYSWYVVAEDAGGGQRVSPTFTFTTRNISGGQIANPAAGFAPRIYHTTFTFSEKLFLLGGMNFMNGVTVFGDIWSTEDGSIWVNETATASFGTGFAYSLTQLENELFLLCGRDFNTGFFDKVWKSTDGVQWNQISPNAAFGKRYSPSVTYNDKLWIAGGIGNNGDFKNDTWVSSDGSDWSAATLNAAFQIREAHQFVVFRDKLWIIGGSATNLGIFVNDVWSSSDGINWVLENDSAAFSPRYNHKVVQYDDKLWLFGGIDGNSVLDDVWYSTDGIQWNQAVQDSPALSGRSYFEVSVFHDKLWIIAGYINGSSKNDVWVFE